MVPRKLPLIIVLGLEQVLWPFWLMDDVKPPFSKNDSTGEITDSNGKIVRCYDEVPKVLQRISAKGIKIALFSSTGYINTAKDLIELFGWEGMFKYTDIYPDYITEQFFRLKNATEVSYSNMLFFESSPSDIRDMTGQGVLSVKVFHGITLDLLEQGLEQFEQKKLHQTETEETFAATENPFASTTRSFAQFMQDLMPPSIESEELAYVPAGKKAESVAQQAYYTQPQQQVTQRAEASDEEWNLAGMQSEEEHTTRRRRRARTIEGPEITTKELVQDDPRYWTPYKSARSYSDAPDETTQQSMITDPWREVLRSGTGMIDPRYTPKSKHVKQTVFPYFTTTKSAPRRQPYGRYSPKSTTVATSFIPRFHTG